MAAVGWCFLLRCKKGNVHAWHGVVGQWLARAVRITVQGAGVSSGGAYLRLLPGPTWSGGRLAVKGGHRVCRWANAVLDGREHDCVQLFCPSNHMPQTSALHYVESLGTWAGLGFDASCLGRAGILCIPVCESLLAGMFSIRIVLLSANDQLQVGRWVSNRSVGAVVLEKKKKKKKKGYSAALHQRRLLRKWDMLHQGLAPAAPIYRREGPPSFNLLPSILEVGGFIMALPLNVP